MRRSALLLLAIGLLASAARAAKVPPLVDVRSVIPGVRVRLRYAGTDNIFHKRFYASERALLRKPVAERLARVQQALRKQGLGLLIWDAYRPTSVQRAMWKLKPNGRYLANPARGSKHSRGAAVDLTLVSLKTSRPLEMPTDHDAFSPKAHRGATRGVSVVAQRNARRLRAAMTAAGFFSNKYEWWHFTAPDWRRYPLSNAPAR